MDELKALPAVEGFGGIKSSTGKIFPPVQMKGVTLSELCKLVGGVSAEQGVRVSGCIGTSRRAPRQLPFPSEGSSHA